MKVLNHHPFETEIRITIKTLDVCSHHRVIFIPTILFVVLSQTILDIIRFLQKTHAYRKIENENK